MAQGTLFSYFGKAKKSEASLAANEETWTKQPGELVWARVEDHPWWPGMLTKHPVQKTMIRGSYKSDQECHVQLFAPPSWAPTRGSCWVPNSNIERFNQKSVNAHSSNDGAFTSAKQAAARALNKPLSDRLADNINDERSAVTTPASKRARYDAPSCVISDDDEDIGHVKTHPSGRPKRTMSRSFMEKQRLKKRRKQMVESVESEDEYHPGNTVETSDDDSSGVDESTLVTNDNQSSDSSHGDIITPMKKKPTSTPRRPSNNRKSSTSTPSSSQLNCSANGTSPGGSNHGYRGDGSFAHDKLDWLKVENRKDAAGRHVTDPAYDSHTLHVPADYMRKQTPGHKQWWLEKRKHFDAVIFFKVGKFYELYHMDAVIGVQECGLAYMKGDYAHSGFPEIAYSRYAQSLVQKGYKVARVEQTETPAMMEERMKKSPAGTPKSSKVVRRELCSIVTKGTITPSFLRGDSLTDTEQAFLLAVIEGPASLGNHGNTTLGVCFVDTCIGKFHVGQFTDDRHCSRLRTMTSHYRPAQMLYPRQRLSTRYHNVISSSSVVKESLTPGTEFWDDARTLKELVGGGYFSDDEEQFDWPEVLAGMLDTSDPVRATVANGYQLAISALGACVWYLRQCCIDHEVLSLKSFKIYTPLDMVTTETNSNQWSSRQHMVLDGVTLTNLDVVNNNSQSQTGTLLERLDHCATPFGRRKLHEWVCAPLCNPTDINHRLDAVETLTKLPSVVAEVKDLMKSLPDMQRLLRRVHTLGSPVQSTNHPDNRAIMYEETVYSKRKINDFLSLINGLQVSIKIVKKLSNEVSASSSRLLWQLATLTSDGGQFPNMAEQLYIFEVSFDHAKARKDGIIIPNKGVNPAYDSALSQITHITQQLDEYLQQQKKRLGCKSIVYWGTGRNRYQLEIPESVVSHHAPEEYDLKSQKKGYRRYWTPNIERLLQQQVDMETQRDDALKDTMRTIFHSFDEHFTLWEAAVNCVCTLDVLCSMAVFSCCSDGDMCRPEVVNNTTTPFLRVEAGRHPCVVHTFMGDDYIPNDTYINDSQHNSCLVVTGPNMGGKSTLMRQTGLIVLLAHMGCYVPATQCAMTPVDRIFTRLGASDRITSGESTFFVELAETSTILQHATQNSLVLLDELGRGTATYDGTAIACAVVKELAEVIGCRTIFSTHYHSLVEEFASNSSITLGHMACMVEDNDSDDIGEETITFLYKLVEGACPKSYGFNAAKLAGLSTEVIRLAYEKAKHFEQVTNEQKLFRKLLELQDYSSICELVEKL